MVSLLLLNSDDPSSPVTFTGSENNASEVPRYGILIPVCLLYTREFFFSELEPLPTNLIPLGGYKMDGRSFYNLGEISFYFTRSQGMIKSTYYGS